MLTGKNVKFSWSDECQAAFYKLKAAFTTSPILAYFDKNWEILVETDASDQK